jgi:hypothetical protein
MLTLTKNLLFAVMEAVPCWCMAMLFFKTWQTPMAIDDGRWVKLAVGIMILEFILVHSGAFLGAFSQRTDITINGRPIKEPHRFPLLAGMFYFGILGVWELAAPFRTGKSKEQDRPAEATSR